MGHSRAIPSPICNPMSNEIGVADLLAVTLMDERYRPGAIRELLWGEAGKRCGELLEKIPTKTPIWQAKDLTGPETELWRPLGALPQVGSTRAAKLMARKRPKLIPVYDSIVGEFVAPAATYWDIYREFLADDDNRAAVDGLRPDGVDNEKLPTLRLVDTAVWMRYSRSVSARKARISVGLG